MRYSVFFFSMLASMSELLWTVRAWSSSLASLLSRTIVCIDNSSQPSIASSLVKKLKTSSRCKTPITMPSSTIQTSSKPEVNMRHKTTSSVSCAWTLARVRTEFATVENSFTRLDATNACSMKLSLPHTQSLVAALSPLPVFGEVNTT